MVLIYGKVFQYDWLTSGKLIFNCILCSIKYPHPPIEGEWSLKLKPKTFKGKCKAKLESLEGWKGGFNQKNPVGAYGCFLKQHTCIQLYVIR